MSMNDLISSYVRSSCNLLRRIQSIHHALRTTSANQLVNLCISSLVDYCNSISVGIPKYQLKRLLSIMNVAARLIFGFSRYEHITPPFKRPATLVAGSAAHRFQAMFDGVHSAAWSHSILRSTSHNCLIVPPPSKTIKFAERSFGISGWNILRDSAKDANCISVFKSLFNYMK